MTERYRITPELRERLKRPLGTLILGSFTETMSEFCDIVTREKPPRIISVGDRVSRNLNDRDVFTQLSIVDNKCMRRNIQPVRLSVDKTIYVKNPQATITDEAMKAIKKALEDNAKTRIVVDGEEDLLTLVAIQYAPVNSLVLYGQPLEGIVVVRTTPEKKAEIAQILREMEPARKAK